jgi:hypothetical protein
MNNYAGRSGPDLDEDLVAELTEAGIEVYRLPEIMRSKGEVQTIIIGTLFGWTFRRAWVYWMCDGPGIEVNAAEDLHKGFGQEVRVDGHCGCPSPRAWFKGLACGNYHVDSQRGLKALADTIKMIASQDSKVRKSGADVGAKIDEWLAWRAEEKMHESRSN